MRRSVVSFVAVCHGEERGFFCCFQTGLGFLDWLVLSDEQMSKRWQFSLLNDEQMSNWLGVKHLPVDPMMSSHEQVKLP